MRLMTVIAAACAALGLSAADARDYRVPADQAGLIRLPGDAAAVVVGNPGIADATLYDARTLFVTGKVFGRTNLIVLDAAGRVLFTTDLVVTQADEGLVQVFTGSNGDMPHTFVCDPVCQAVPQIGDADDRFNTLEGQRARTRGGAGSGLQGG